MYYDNTNIIIIIIRCVQLPIYHAYAVIINLNKLELSVEEIYLKNIYNNI